jgi:DTW domain-containing protein YfiP
MSSTPPLPPPQAKQPPNKMIRKNGTSSEEVDSLDIQNKDKNLYLAAIRVKRKEEQFIASQRCEKCWFSKTNGSCACICELLPPLPFEANTEFIVYMHNGELYNAGDDAKLLLNAAPDRTKIFVFGKEGDDDALLEEITKDGSLERTVLLFPSETALTVDEIQGSHVRKFCQFNSREDDSSKSPLPLKVMVVDGTWRQVKAMVTHLERMVLNQTIIPNATPIPHVKLSPTQLSVYARTQSQPDRICTIEALSMFIEGCGEDPNVCQRLVEYVTINNEALKPTKKKGAKGGVVEGEGVTAVPT